MFDSQKMAEVIAMPDWQTRLLPLFQFKGTRPHFIRRNLSYAYWMYLEECNRFADAKRIIEADKPSAHLCGNHAKYIDSSLLRHSFNRLRHCPQVTDTFGKAFTEYVEYMHPVIHELHPVPLTVNHWRNDGSIAFWRVREFPIRQKRERKPTILKPKRKPTILKPKWWNVGNDVYSEIQRHHSADHKLVIDIHDAIPSSVPLEVRGDLCQDLIVAVLSGETKLENIPDVIAAYAKQAKRMMPDRWKTVSLDAPISEENDGNGYDRLRSSCEHF